MGARAACDAGRHRHRQHRRRRAVRDRWSYRLLPLPLLLIPLRPPSIPVGAATATRLGGADALLALAQMLLTYALLGGPLPGLPALLRPVTAVARPRRRLLAEATSCLLLRLLLLAVVVAMRWAGRSVTPASDPPHSEQPGSFTAALTAATVNDALARAPGLLALALLVAGFAGSTSAATKAGVAMLFAASAAWFGGSSANRLRPRASLPNR